MLTWQDDVSSILQVSSSARGKSTGAWVRCQKFYRRVRARVLSDYGRNFRVCRAVDEEAVGAARVPIRRSEIQESEAARGRVSESTAARGGAWQGY